MSHALLITGSHQEGRQAALNQVLKEKMGLAGVKPHPDLLVVEGERSIGVSQIRQLKKRLALKPYQASIKIGLLMEAERMTLVAQNALLKTLEEPPAHSLLILTTSQPEKLLPTVRSRCQILTLAPAQKLTAKTAQLTEARQQLTQLLKAGVGERLMVVQPYSQNRLLAQEFVVGQLVLWRQKLRQKPTRGRAHQLRRAQEALLALEQNVNPKLVVDNFVLGYPL